MRFLIVNCISWMALTYIYVLLFPDAERLLTMAAAAAVLCLFELSNMRDKEERKP